MLGNLELKYVTLVSEGSVYPVKQGRQTMGFAFYYITGDGGKKRKVVTGSSREELKSKATAFLNKVENECLEALCKADGALREAVRPRTFMEASHEWFEKYKMGEKSFPSVESRKFSISAINKVIGEMNVSDIDNDVASDMIMKCSIKAGGGYYSRGRVDKLQQAFRMVMEYSRKKGYCACVPDKVKLSGRLTTVDKDSRFLDLEQLALVHKVLEDNARYRTLFHLLFATGLRQEEAFALKVGDFRVTRNRKGKENAEASICKTVVETEGHVYKIVNRTKTAKSRRKVYIPKVIYDMVMKYYEDTAGKETASQKAQRKANGTEGCIFVNQDMKPLNKRTFERNFESYIKRNGRGAINFKVTLHMLRHSFVSLHLDDMGIEQVSKLIGDSYKTTSEMYQSLTNKTKTKVCNNSEEFYNIIVKRGEGMGRII